MRWAAVLAFAGCVATPDRPKGSDANIGTSDATRDAALRQVCVEYSPWGSQQKIAGVSSDVEDDWAPSLSADNLSLVFHSTRGGSPGRAYEAKRASIADAFGPAEELTLTGYDNSPVLSPDGLRLYYTNWSGSSADIYTAARTSLDAQFDANAPEPFMPFNGPAHEQDLTFGGGMLDVVLKHGSSSEEQEIYIASRSSPLSQFSGATLITEIAANGVEDCCPTLSPDGLTLLWESARMGTYAIWQAERATRESPFANVRLSTTHGVTSPFVNGDPHFSYDGTIMVFSSRRGNMNYDIWWQTRQCTRYEVR